MHTCKPISTLVHHTANHVELSGALNPRCPPSSKVLQVFSSGPCPRTTCLHIIVGLLNMEDHSLDGETLASIVRTASQQDHHDHEEPSHEGLLETSNEFNFEFEHVIDVQPLHNHAAGYVPDIGVFPPQIPWVSFIYTIFNLTAYL